jgi:phenylacetate-CoA ligase
VLSQARLLEAAARHPLYEGWDFSRITSFDNEAWRHLPTLQSERLRATQAQGRQGPELLFYSSGTTGDPKMVRYSLEDLGRVGELCARFARFEGVTEHSRVMVLLPMGLWTVGKITVDGHRLAGAEVFPVDLHGGIETWQCMVDLIRPTVISSTPSVLAAWAPHYQGPRLEMVETTGEPLLDSERHLIEARFGAFVHDAYGLSECVVGTECRVRNGFHYWPDATRVEVLEPYSDRSVPEGVLGELVVTSLMQEHMPILRYRSGDKGHIDQQRCICGCEGPRVHLEGRIADTLVLPRAVKLDVSELTTLISAQVAGARFRYKGAPSNPAAPFVGDSFRPALEVYIPTGQTNQQEALRQELLTALPELAELVHEQELDLYFPTGGKVSPVVASQ